MFCHAEPDGGADDAPECVTAERECKGRTAGGGARRPVCLAPERRVARRGGAF